MTASSTDLFKKLARKWVGQIGSGGVADAVVTTVPLSSATNLPTDTAVVAVIDRVDANGTKTSTLEESVIGVVSSSNLVTCTRGAEGTAQAHSAGAVVEILVTNKGWNDIVDGILAGHSQLGAHTTDTISEKTSAAGVTIDGVLLKDNDATLDEITAKTANTPVKINDGHHVVPIAYTPDAAATATLNVSQSNIHSITMPAGNITIAISNETAGQCFLVEITQDGTGSRTVTWFTTIKWAGGSAPTLTTTASKRDVFGFRVTSADNYDGFVVGQNI